VRVDDRPSARPVQPAAATRASCRRDTIVAARAVRNFIASEYILLSMTDTSRARGHDRRRRIRRRRLLSTVGAAAGTGILAGCAGSEDGDDSDGTDDSDGASDADDGDESGTDGGDGDGDSGGEESEPEASLSVDDQSGLGNRLVVDFARASVEYYLSLAYGGTEAQTQDIDDGTSKADLRLYIYTAFGETVDVTVRVIGSDTQEPLAMETIEYRTEDVSLEDGGPPNSDEWELSFVDEFDGGELDTDVWSHGMGEAPLDCPAHEGPNICAVEDYAYVDPETDRLILEASEDTPTVPDDQERIPESPPEYSVGAVASEGGFEQEFGYFEIKSKVPTEPGTLPAAWFYINLEEYNWREPHLYEKRGSEPADQVRMGAIWADDSQFDPNYEAHAGDGAVRTGTPTGETFHVYGLEWRPDSLTWYVNGEEVGGSSKDPIEEHLAGQAVYWILNHSVFDGADWVGYPENAEFPSHHEVEWVRAWRHEDHDEWVDEH